MFKALIAYCRPHTEPKDSTDTESLIAEDSTNVDNLLAEKHPFASLINTRIRTCGRFLPIKDTAKVDRMLHDPEVMKARPEELRHAKFLWGKPEPGKDIIPLYAGER